MILGIRCPGRLTSIGLYAVTGVAAAAVLVDAVLGLAESAEASSSVVPLVVSAVVLVLIVAMAVDDHLAGPDTAPRTGASDWGAAGWLFILLVSGYAFAMQAGWGFALVTSAFLAASFATLGGMETRRLALTIPLAGLIGFGSDFLFRSVFYIDLP